MMHYDEQLDIQNKRVKKPNRYGRKDMPQCKQYSIYFIMQKVIEKSLRATVLQEIFKLNIANAQFYAILRKLNSTDHHLNQTFTDKLESMKADIRNKIKQLSYNVDLMYQVFDRKISILIRNIQQNSGSSTNVQQQLRASHIRLQELEEQLKQTKSKYNSVLTQNQFLKNKNIALVQELQVLSKKKVPTLTNDSSRNLNQKTEQTSDPQTSIFMYGSPILQQTRAAYAQGNDLTFNKSPTKKIKSEQNSFSSLLIREQNSFQPSYGSDRNNQNNGNLSGKLGFGCMPVRQNNSFNQNIGNIKYESSRKRYLGRDPQEQNVDGDQTHRMSFLINNLKQSEQQSFTSSDSSRYHFSREESANKSVLSRGAVKKYHI